jgi:hypothetical protein
LTDYAVSRAERRASAGGQLEQPSEVNSSTTTGAAVEPCGDGDGFREGVAATARPEEWFSRNAVATHPSARITVAALRDLINEEAPKMVRLGRTKEVTEKHARDG